MHIPPELTKYLNLLSEALKLLIKEINLSQVLELIEEVDLSDPSQAQAARDAVGEMLKPPDDSLSPIPTRPTNKKKKKQQSQDTNSDGGDASDPNTDYGEEGKENLILYKILQGGPSAQLFGLVYYDSGCSTFCQDLPGMF